MEGFLQSLKDLNLTTGQTVIIALFLLAWLECMAAWVFGFFEHWAIRRLSGKFFGLGFVIWRDAFDVHPPYLTGDTVLKLSHSQLRVMEPNYLIFSTLGRRELGTEILSTLKGEAKWIGGTAEVAIRLPFASVYFMLSWLSVCVIWAIMGFMFSIPLATMVIPAAMLTGGIIMLRFTWKKARQDSELLAVDIMQHLGVRTSRSTDT